MASFVPWIEVTIPGFVFLAAACLVLFRCIHKYDLEVPKTLTAYVPYVAVGAVFLAYTTGFALHLALHKLISLFSISATPSVSQLVAQRETLPKEILDAFGGMYGNLVMFRLLATAFFLLFFALWNWLPRTALRKPHWPVFVVCMLFVVLFSFAYFVQRALFTDFRDDVKAKYPALYIH